MHRMLFLTPLTKPGKWESSLCVCLCRFPKYPARIFLLYVDCAYIALAAKQATVPRRGTAALAS